MNGSLKLQIQKAEKFQKLIEQQHSNSQNKHEAFKMAKSLLVNVHAKKKEVSSNSTTIIIIINNIIC